MASFTGGGQFNKCFSHIGQKQILGQPASLMQDSLSKITDAGDAVKIYTDIIFRPFMNTVLLDMFCFQHHIHNLLHYSNTATGRHSNDPL